MCLTCLYIFLKRLHANDAGSKKRAVRQQQINKMSFFFVLLSVASQLQAPSIQLHHNQHVITNNN